VTVTCGVPNSARALLVAEDRHVVFSTYQSSPALFDQVESGALVRMVTNATQTTLYPLLNERRGPDPDELDEGQPGVPASSSSVLAAVVPAGGVIDALHVEPLVAELTGAMDAGATKLLVDLSAAETVTAAGMNALLAARQRLIGQGGQVSVVLPRALRRRFHTLQLDRRLLIASDRLQAATKLGLAAGRRVPGVRAWRGRRLT
jgi:anti-anti-sigma regulatory factor